MEDMIVVTELGKSIRLPRNINCVGHKSDYTSKIFTVEVGDDVFVYEHPKDASKKEIRTAIALDFCYLDEGYTDKVTGRYPNYIIEEVN